MNHDDASFRNILPELLAELTTLSPKRALFWRYLLDPTSAAFANKTKAAELAGYAGEPGSNQLAVQGHRIASDPKMQLRLAAAFEAAGLTPERDAEVLRDAYGATRSRCYLGPDGQLIFSPAEPDHPTRLRAVDMKHQILHRYMRSSGKTQHGFTPTNTAGPEPPLQISPQVADWTPAVREAVRQAARLEQQLADDINREQDEQNREQDEQKDDGQQPK